MFHQAHGVKRKADENNPDQIEKRVKLTELAYELPEDCWNNILGFLEVESASPLFFVARFFRHLHNSFMVQRYNRIFGLSRDLANLLPASVTVAESKLGVLVAFEKAISCVKSKKYEQLQSVLKQIKRQADTVLLTPREHRDVPLLVIDFLKSSKSPLHIERVRTFATVWAATDSKVTNINEKSTLVWIGKDGRYIDFHCTYHSLYSVADSQGWLELKITADLKHLNEKTTTEQIVLEFRKDPNDDSYLHSIRSLVRDKSTLFRTEEVQKIVDWLQLDRATKFVDFLIYSAFSPERIILYADSLEYSVSECDEYVVECGGDMSKEISKVLQGYLKGDAGWRLITHLLDQWSVKAALLDCVNCRAEFSSEEAKEELADLFERSLITGCSLNQLAVFDIPTTKSNDGTTVINVVQTFKLLIPTTDQPTTMLVNIFCDGDLLGGLSLLHEFELINHHQTSVLKYSKQSFTKHTKMADWKQSNFKHVTADDIFAVMLAYFDYPKSLESIIAEAEQRQERARDG